MKTLPGKVSGFEMDGKFLRCTVEQIIVSHLITQTIGED